MKKHSRLEIFTLSGILMFWFSLSLFSAAQFQVVEEWKHDTEIFGNIWHSTIDNDGHVIGAFYKTGLRLITPDKVSVMARFGQGKGDIEDFMAVFQYKNDIAVVEHPWKIKIFTKKSGAYEEKEIIKLRRPKFPFLINTGLFVKNKWVLSGEGNKDYIPNIEHLFYIKFYNTNGDPLAIAVECTQKPTYVYANMSNYLAADEKNNRLFYMREDQLLLRIIDTNSMNVTKTINLETPASYQKMPEDFYTLEKYKAAGSKRFILVDTWKTSYSRITKMLLQDNYLVIQIRTPDKGPKKFTLLFYNLDSFKLEKNIPIDDFLMGAKDGKYYFYADGNPTYDEDTDDCTICIYQWKN